MHRQTECRDYSDGQFPGLAVIRANNRFHVVHVGVPVAVGQKTTFRTGFVLSATNLPYFSYGNSALSAVLATLYRV